MPIGGDPAQRRLLGGTGGVEIDAVEVVTRLLGGDGKLGLVDEPFQIGGRDFELVRHVARGQIGKIALWQRLQGEPGTAGANRQHRAVAGRFEDDLRAFRKLAHDLVEHVRRDRSRAPRAHLGGDRLGHLDVEVGRLEG